MIPSSFPGRISEIVKFQVISWILQLMGKSVKFQVISWILQLMGKKSWSHVFRLSRNRGKDDSDDGPYFIPRMPRGPAQPGYIPARLWCIVLLMERVFKPMRPFSVSDCFAGKCAISKAFLRNNMRAAALDFELDERDEIWQQFWVVAVRCVMICNDAQKHMICNDLCYLRGQLTLVMAPISVHGMHAMENYCHPGSKSMT